MIRFQFAFIYQGYDYSPPGDKSKVDAETAAEAATYAKEWLKNDPDPDPFGSDPPHTILITGRSDVGFIGSTFDYETLTQTR